MHDYKILSHLKKQKMAFHLYIIITKNVQIGNS